jgi:hypothetical protein
LPDTLSQSAFRTIPGLFNTWTVYFLINLTTNTHASRKTITGTGSRALNDRRPQKLPSAVPVQLLRLMLLFSFVIILFLRMPDVFFGRFWAEEGSVFFVTAASLPWWSAMLHSYGGYLNIVANTASVIAFHAVPLEDAPLVTTAIGLAFQCCPAILLLYSRDAWLKSQWTVIAALLIIATPPMVTEVWLQSMHSQFHLALCCAIILALDLPTRPMAWFSGIILFIAPLCGPAGASLLPLFLARAAVDRSWPRFLQALILTLGTIIQFAFFYSHQAGRVYHINPLILIYDVYVRQILTPLGGWKIAHIASVSIQQHLANHLVPWVPLVATCSIVILIAFGLWRRGTAAFVWLFVAAGLTTVVSYYGAFDTGMVLLAPNLEGRYTFIPQILAALAVLGLATGTKAPDCWIAGAVVVALIAIGILCMSGYRPISGPAWMVKWIIHGPDWHHEVALWRLDPSLALRVWPDGWTMTLPRK